MVSRDAKVTALFVAPATVLWLLARRFTSNSWLLWAVLVGVGDVPTLVNGMTNR